MKKLIILFIILLIVGAYLIKTNYNLNLQDKKDQVTFLKVFTSWISKLFENTKEVTALAVKQDWLPENNQTEK